jgi:hypothetical protein
MPRRSPAYAERITVAARFVTTPAAHFTPLLTFMRDLGYFDPKRAAIAAIEAQAQRIHPSSASEARP